MAASEGVDLEWAIVDMARRQKPSRNYSPKIKTQATKCVEHIVKSLGNKFEIYHSDENVQGIGSIFAKPEPKTDVVIFVAGKKYFVSVKMEGGIQLASGQGASTAELFEAAASDLTDAKSVTVLKSIIKSLKTMPTRLLSQSNFDRIMEEGNDKVITEFIKKGKIIQDKSYEHWLENNKPQLMAALLKFIKSNDKFYDALIYEAMTGKKTLSKYRGAVANSIISPSGFHMIDKKYVDKIKPKIKMDLRAKSRGGISSVAFRIETKGSV